MNYLVIILVAVAIFIVSLLQNVAKRNFYKQLANILYKQHDGKLYLEKINSFKGKWFLNKKTRLFMSIDGYLLENDLNGAIELFKQLENMKLSITKKIGLYRKETEVYLDAHMDEQAIIANDKLQDFVSQISDASVEQMAEELNDQVEINVKHNGDLAEKMIERAKSMPDGFGKAIYYYRGAKCYYFKGDSARVSKYLEKALNLSNQSIWRKQIEDCIKDNSNFLNK